MLSEIWSDLRYRLRALFRRSAMERELEAEMGYHLEREAAKYRAAGATPAEARRRARLAFGGVERFKEESRDSRGIRLLEMFGRDLRSAVRGIRANPGFAISVVLTLALGIGANAAMFGIVDRLMFRPPPFLRDPDRVHRLYFTATYRGREDNDYGTTQYTRYLDVRRWATSIAAAGAWFEPDLAIGIGTDAREMRVGAMSASLWDFFDATPMLGRFFTAAEDTVPRGAQVAVLSHWFWRTRYGGRADAVGRSIQIGPLSYVVIGVAPKGFVGLAEGSSPAAFIPITAHAPTMDGSGNPSGYYTTYHWSWMRMVVRRKAGVDVGAATADLTGAYRRSWAAERAQSPHTSPIEIAHPRVIVASVLSERGPNRTSIAKVATWLVGVATIVLLVACANVANLLLARSLRRRREIALRLALGVGRGRLFAQLLTESLLLAALGGAAGWLVARSGRSVLTALFLPDAGRPPATGPMVMVAAIAALLAGLLTGLAPILQTRRADLAGALKAGGRGGSGQRSRARSLLLVIQGTLSVVLLVGAGLFVRSLQKVRSLRLGYDADRVTVVDLNLRGVKLTPDARAALETRLEEAAKAIPGVETASRAATVPFWTSWSESFFVAGIDSVQRLGHFTIQAGSPDYFATMGTRILRGRGITAADRAGGPRAVIVSEAMGARLWPGKDPIGQCIRMMADTMPCSTVVGVAENIHRTSLTDDSGLHYYVPIDQLPPRGTNLLVRLRDQSESAAAATRETVRRELQKLIPGTAYVTAMPLQDAVNPELRSWRIGATMFLAFGGMALVLAAVGLYSVIAYNVTQRTSELGLRIALGAGAGAVRRLVVAEGLRFAAGGVALGIVIALAAGPWVRPLLFAQSPTDPLVYGAVAAILLAVAAAASAIPAGRATRVDPSIALRAD